MMMHGLANFKFVSLLFTYFGFRDKSVGVVNVLCLSVDVIKFGMCSCPRGRSVR
jgi:hypothetical protein